MNKAPEYRVGIGASSIIMIFIVLSLTTLGVLSFASARSDLILTERRQSQVESYYNSVSLAQQMIAQIDSALLKAAATPETFEEAVGAIGEIDSLITVDGMQISFQLPVGETQSLAITLDVHAPGGDAGRYSLSKHQLIYSADWEADNSIHLLTEAP